MDAIVLESINFSEEHQYLVCACGYHATGLIDGLAHHSECTVRALRAAAETVGVEVRWFQVAAQTIVLSEAEVSDLEARCAETERAEDFDSSTEGPW